MSLQFQPPSFVQPKDYSGLSSSIDNLFNAYQSGKMQNLQLQALQANLDAARQGQATAQAQFALNSGGLTAEEVNRFMPQAVQPQPMVPQSMAAPVGPQQTFTDQIKNGQQAAPVPAQEDPRVSTLRGILQMHLQGAQLAARKTSADTRSSEAKASLDQANADLISGAGQGGGVISNVLAAVERKDLAPSQADDYLGRNPPVHLGFVNALAKSGLNARALENEYKKSNAQAAYEGGSQVQSPIRMINSALPIIGDLRDSAASAGFGKSPVFNDARATFIKQFGSPEDQKALADHIAKTEEGRAQLAQVFANNGAPTDVAQKRANELIPDYAGPDVLEQLGKSTVPYLLGGRVAALEKRPIPGQNKNAQSNRTGKDPLGLFK